MDPNVCLIYLVVNTTVLTAFSTDSNVSRSSRVSPSRSNKFGTAALLSECSDIILRSGTSQQTCSLISLATYQN